MKKLIIQATMTGAVMAALIACGTERTELSQPEWQQSRANTERYAYLWQSDLQDEFLFGASVIEVDDFISGALNMTVDPVRVQLSAANDKLSVKTSDRDELIFQFDTSNDSGRIEVDFASAGNDVQLRGLIDTYGGIFSVSSQDGFWISEGAPTVRGVSQDNDTVVVDLLHTVSQVILGTDASGNPVIRQRISDHPGRVLVRIWLQRINSLPRLPTNARKTVTQARNRNLGFFPAAWGDDDDRSQIMRFPIEDVGNDETVTFYLKDFPSHLVDAGVAAVDSWNQAFGRDVFRAQVAPFGIDAGDPRYNVIKWFDGVDNYVGWAGVAKPVVNPITGIVMSGGIYIQGDPMAQGLEDLAAFTQLVQDEPITPTGTIGGIDFTLDEGEVPVIPYFTDGTDPETYVHSYYVETIAHEVGHVVGLRHNFKGSTLLSASGQSASVMDYTSRSSAGRNPGPGVYDVAAVRWAYMNERNDQRLPFCTDDHVATQWDCNQGDEGDPVNYVIRSLVDGTNFLTQLTVEVEENRFISSMVGTVNAANKLWSLRNTMPTAKRRLLEERLPTAYQYVFDAEPAPGLSSRERQIVARNLARLRQLVGSE